MNIKQKKQHFLKKIMGNRLEYKRFTESPLRYAGGKSLAVGKIIEYLPDNIDRVISPFIGGGSVEIAISKYLEIDVIAFDIFDLLVNYWQEQISHPQLLYEELKLLEPTEICYSRIKDILKKHWNKSTGYDNQLDPIKAAAYYYYNMQLSYGPGFLGWMSSIYKSEKKYLSTIEKVKNFTNQHLQVFQSDYEKVLSNYNNDFMYLDPPYYLDGDSKMFKGIYPMRNFPIHHNGFDHQKLADLLKKHKGGFILSYNDCSWVRETYKDFQILEVGWQYTMGQGETRIGKNRKNRSFDNSNIKTSHELLIIGRKYEN